ncbi:MAG: triose-phosphate isomerase, partial [Verrucomicrobia bacterium]|nr:triose-phosphate isomerase [Verrucomicrobiota bacterium]
AIQAAKQRAQDTPVIIGAQNMNDASEGAFTGEVAGQMLKDAGASFVILGHSERRRYFQESNEFINRKVKRALECGLQPVLCVGESYEDHQNNLVHEVVKAEIEECLAGVDKKDAESIVLSYEPIWAIGTGLPATPEVVSDVHHYCREVLAELWGKTEAKKVPILYGGSVNPNNAAEFLQTADVDGLLIGTASLQPESFTKIISLCQNTSTKV